MTTDKKKSIPIIGFVLHRLKLLCKSKLLTNEGLDQMLEQKKENAHKVEELDLNVSPKIGISMPLNIIGHILEWYHIPVIIGITISLIYGYYFELYIRFIDWMDTNVIFRIVFFILGLFPLALIASFVAFLRTFDEEYDIVGDGKHLLNANDLTLVSHSLPWNEAEPEVEGVDWIRRLLEQLWSNVNIFLIRLVSTYCPNCSMELLLGPINRLADFEIKKLYLGERVPEITGIHVMNRGVKREDLIVDFEFTYDSDIQIEISGKYDIDFGIKWFYFKAKTRILLSPLFRDLPVVGNLQVSFLEKPKINWEFTGLLRALNWDLLKNCVQCLLSFFLENPHYFVINLAKILPLREKKLREPIGLLRIEIMSGKYIQRKDGSKVIRCIPAWTKPDPYCKIEVEEEEQSTHIVQSDSNPDWNQEFCFLVHNSIVNSIVMSVFDEDMIEDQLIGRFSIPIKDFVDYKELNGREVLVPLTPIGEKPKPIEKRVPRMSFRVSWFRLTTDVKLLDISLRLTRAQLPVAALSVLIDSATGLDTCTAQVRSPELRPLVKISVGNQVRYTTCKRRTGCPVWEESHHFIINNPIMETIRIEVIDMYWVEEKQIFPFIPVSVSSFGSIANTIGLTDKGTVLGSYDIQTIDIMRAHKMKIEDSYRLNGFVENGYIRLLTTIRIAEFEPQITQNVRKPQTLLSDLMIDINKNIEIQKKIEKQKKEMEKMKTKLEANQKKDSFMAQVMAQVVANPQQNKEKEEQKDKEEEFEPLTN